MPALMAVGLPRLNPPPSPLIVRIVVPAGEAATTNLALGALAAGDQRTVAPPGRVHCRRGQDAKWLRADELSEIRMGRYPAGHFPLLRYAEATQMPFRDPPHRQM